ncbi:MAG: ABC transporter permease [Chitinophagaceae bacterium]|nr:ABC transporter permease [Chitinophagaceae bacterium]
MFRSISKIVIRNLWKYKGYTLINIAGLGIGIAAMVWGFQTYQFSFSFDNFHKDQDHVYRAVTYKEGADGMKGIFPMAAVQAAKSEFPGIEEAVKLDADWLNVKGQKAETFAEHAHFTDPAFFDLFNFPLVAGSKDINDKTAVLITENTAKKYFGDENPLGKTLLFYPGLPHETALTVKGILKDVPMNSTIQFEFITNFINLRKPDGTVVNPDDWKWFLEAAYFKIPNNTDAKGLAEKLNKYLPLQNKAREDWKTSGFKLLSIKENAAQSNSIDANDFIERPGDSAAYSPLVLAFLLLLSACLNFSNTTVAKASQKLKEIGMRKVMGGTQQQLVAQLLLECAAVVFIAILLSVLINMWWLPIFNNMFTYIDVQANYLHDISLLIFLLVTLLFTALLAGAYPAFYIAGFNPSSIFRGNVKFGGSNIFSRLMLGLQISIAIITVVAGMSFARNASFQKTYDFGYNLENCIGVFVKDKNTFDALKNEMAAMPQVTGLAGCRHHIGFERRSKVPEAEGIKKETRYFEVGRDYVDVMKLKMATGRSFDKERESDYANAILVSQKFAAMYGWNDQQALNKQLRIDTAVYSVVGVMKDFHCNSLFEPMEPTVMKLVKEDKYSYLILQARQGDLTNVFEQTKKAWQKLFPLQPFRGFYQNEIIAESYKVSNSIATIFSWVAFVSILLTAAGLFALVSLTVLKKMKEIAIRKVAGANPGHVLVLITKGYCWIFILAAMLGSAAGYALTKLLLDLIFKVNAGVSNGTMFTGVMVLLAIAAITTGIKVLQAVRTNPVKMLRSE